jgi:hydrogenase nickel incorporation protein HypA/HybF
VHELAIAESVVQIAADHAAGRRVLKVELSVGHLRQVVPSALEFAFEIVARGTPVEGAELELREVPPAGVCRTCEVSTALERFPFSCERCGGYDIELTHGEELLVDALEVE